MEIWDVFSTNLPVSAQTASTHFFSAVIRTAKGAALLNIFRVFRASFPPALFGVLLFLVACEGEQDIVHGLDELEANHILVVLESQGVTAGKMKEEGRIPTWAVIVPEGRAMEALRILVANRLPKPRSQGLAQVYPAGSGGLIPTKTEEKAKFLLALQGEVENMLKALPGVQDARVTVVVPEKDIVRDLDTPPPPATASVAIVYNPENDAKPIEEDKVRELVAAAVEDLKPNNVKVVMKENRPPILISSSGDALSGDNGPPETVLGIRVVDANAGKKAKQRLALFGVAAVLGVALGIFGVVRMVMLNRKLAKSDAELASIKKARRETT